MSIAEPILLTPGPLTTSARTRLKQQPPAEWKDLSDSDRTAKLRDGVIKFWSASDVLLRQLGQSFFG